MPGTENLFSLFTTQLNNLEIGYVVTGSVAGIIYGEPRLTHDVDLVVEFPESAVNSLHTAFPESAYYLPPENVIRIEITRRTRGHFNIIHLDSGLKADIYLVGSDPLLKWALKKKRRFELGPEYVWVAPPEYVILKKLEYYAEGKSEKHLRDIWAINKNSGEQLDLNWLEQQISERFLQAEWELAKGYDTL